MTLLQVIGPKEFGLVDFIPGHRDTPSATPIAGSSGAGRRYDCGDAPTTLALGAPHVRQRSESGPSKDVDHAARPHTLRRAEGRTPAERCGPGGQVGGNLPGHNGRRDPVDCRPIAICAKLAHRLRPALSPQCRVRDGRASGSRR